MINVLPKKQNPGLLLPVAVIAAMIGGAGAALFAKQEIGAAAFAIAVIVGALLWARKAGVLIAFLIAWSATLLLILQPEKNGGDQATGLQLYDLVFLLWALVWLTDKLRTGSLRAPRGPIFVGLGFVIAGRFISFVFSPYSELDNLFSMFRYLECLAVILLTCEYFRANRAYRQQFVWGLTIAAIIECSIGIFQIVSSGGELRGLGSNQHGTGWLPLWTFLFYLHSLSQPRDETLPVPQWARWAIAGYCLLGILVTLTRALWIQWAICMLVFILFAGRKRNRYLAIVGAVLALGGAAIVVLPSSVSGAVTNRVQSTEDLASGTTGIRLFLWSVATQMFVEHPATGIGTGNFGRVKSLYADPRFLIMLQTYDTLSTHNTAFGFLAETGVVGTFCFLVWCGTLLWTAVRVRKTPQPTGFDAALAEATAVVLISAVLMDFYSQACFLEWSNVAVGLLLAMGAVSRSAAQPLSRPTRAQPAPPLRVEGAARSGAPTG